MYFSHNSKIDVLNNITFSGRFQFGSFLREIIPEFENILKCDLTNIRGKIFREINVQKDKVISQNFF